MPSVFVESRIPWFGFPLKGNVKNLPLQSINGIIYTICVPTKCVDAVSEKHHISFRSLSLWYA